MHTDTSPSQQPWSSQSRATSSRDVLRSLVCEWTLILKEAGLPPEKALVSVKTLVRRVIAPHIAFYGDGDAGEHSIALIADSSQWCIDAYFSTAQPQRTGHNWSREEATARRSLARRLLLKFVVMHPEPSIPVLAERLGMDVRQLAAFASGTQLMPPEMQERLADFVAEHEPRLARLAHRLRLQNHAARRYQAGDVVRHMTSPPAPW